MADTEPNDNAFSDMNSHSDSTLSPDRETSGPRVKDGPGRKRFTLTVSVFDLSVKKRPSNFGLFKHLLRNLNFFFCKILQKLSGIVGVM